MILCPKSGHLSILYSDTLYIVAHKSGVAFEIGTAKFKKRKDKQRRNVMTDPTFKEVPIFMYFPLCMACIKLLLLPKILLLMYQIFHLPFQYYM
jgi:hypothetical protein